MDSSAHGDKKNSNETSLPERWLNVAILFNAFLYKAMNGLGVLATVWATVVLLGGFSTLVKQQDFWYVTVIAFVQSMGILGGYEDPAHQIFMRAAGALRRQDLATNRDGQEIFGWWRHKGIIQQPERRVRRSTRRMSRQQLLKMRQEELNGRVERFQQLFGNYLGGFIDTALVLGQVAAAATCISLSWMRLRKHDFVEPKNLYHDDHRNISRSLTIFYSLVLAQGITFICMRLNPLPPWIRIMVQEEYNLFWPWSRIVFRYMGENYLELITGNVRATLNMDLITYTKNLVASNSLDDQLFGLRSMNRIFGAVKYRSLVLVELRASLDDEALGKLVNMLGFSGTTKEEDIRGHAARVVLRLAPQILVRTCPGDGILSLISSSLLNNATLSSNRSTMGPELVWFGLRILDKLTDNPENCKQVNKDRGDLLGKIIDIVTNMCSQDGGSGTLSDSWVEHEVIAPLIQTEEDIPLPTKKKIDQEIIIAMSLNILSKLVAAPGASEVLGRETSSKDFQFLTSTGMVSKHVGAARLISCAAVASNKARAEIGMLPGILNNLKGCLLSKAPYVNISKVAAKLLLLEFTSSDRLDHIQLFINGNRVLEDQLQLPVSAFIQELDLDELSMPVMQSKVQRLDLEDLLSAPPVNHCEEAAKALLLLTTDCEDNVAAFLQEISIQDLEKIVNLLSPEDEDQERRRTLAHIEGRHLQPEILRVIKKMICAEGGELRRSMHAKLLQNLRAYSGEKKFDRHMEVIDTALPVVFKAILDEVAILEDPSSTDENLGRVKDDLWIKGGKVLESFIGLAVQICRPMDTSMFAEKLCDAKLNVDIWVKKLKKILELYKSPTTEFPYIRRCTLELLIWMVENNSSNIEVLLQCGVYEQLHEVAKTARKLESFNLFHCGDGVPAGSGIPCISSLATTLQQKLQLSPCFKERSSSNRDASTISVIIV